MTIYYVTAANSVISETGPGFTILPGGDVLTILSGGFVGTKDPNSIGLALTFGFSTSTMNINGEVSGNKAGIYFGAGSYATLNVNIGSEGSVFSSAGPAIQSVPVGGNTQQI